MVSLTGYCWLHIYRSLFVTSEEFELHLQNHPIHYYSRQTSITSVLLSKAIHHSSKFRLKLFPLRQLISWERLIRNLHILFANSFNACKIIKTHIHTHTSKNVSLHSWTFLLRSGSQRTKRPFSAKEVSANFINCGLLTYVISRTHFIAPNITLDTNQLTKQANVIRGRTQRPADDDEKTQNGSKLKGPEKYIQGKTFLEFCVCQTRHRSQKSIPQPHVLPK